MVCLTAIVIEIEEIAALLVRVRKSSPYHRWSPAIDGVTVTPLAVLAVSAPAVVVVVAKVVVVAGVVVVVTGVVVVVAAMVVVAAEVVVVAAEVVVVATEVVEVVVADTTVVVEPPTEQANFGGNPGVIVNTQSLTVSCTPETVAPAGTTINGSAPATEVDMSAMVAGYLLLLTKYTFEAVLAASAEAAHDAAEALPVS